MTLKNPLPEHPGKSTLLSSCTQKADIHQIYCRFRPVSYQLAQMYTAFIAKGARGGAISRKIAGSFPNGANISCG